MNRDDFAFWMVVGAASVIAIGVIVMAVGIIAKVLMT